MIHHNLIPLLLGATLFSLVRADSPKTPLGESLKDIDVADHWIYDDWPTAVAQAKETGKPLLVVLRCVPCPPGKSLDVAVMQPDESLTELEKKFVCVRIIQANRLDLDLFQYDYDMSWAAMFLNADGAIYGRYGSRNASGPQSDALLSVAAFRKAAERALALHAGYPANMAQLAAKTGAKAPYSLPTQVPGLTERPTEATTRQQCIHCHMVKEYALRAKWEAGKLTAADLFVFPQPTNIGFATDLDDGLLVSSVSAGSPAAAAGITPGNEIASIGGQPLISLADIQWALHAAPSEGKLPVTIRRGGKLLDKTIVLAPGWKKSDIAWRASSWYGLRQGLKTEPLPDDQKASRGLAAGSLALVIKNLYGKSATALPAAGVKKDDIIVAIDGQTTAMTESEFLVHLRLSHGPKDSVKLTILRNSQRHQLSIPMW
jgi:membrane-associated protease RseP (regulator of RpoE activity)